MTIKQLMETIKTELAAYADNEKAIRAELDAALAAAPKDGPAISRLTAEVAAYDAAIIKLDGAKDPKQNGLLDDLEQYRWEIRDAILAAARPMAQKAAEAETAIMAVEEKIGGLRLRADGPERSKSGKKIDELEQRLMKARALLALDLASGKLNEEHEQTVLARASQAEIENRLAVLKTEADTVYVKPVREALAEIESLKAKHVQHFSKKRAAEQRLEQIEAMFAETRKRLDETVGEFRRLSKGLRENLKKRLKKLAPVLSPVSLHGVNSAEGPVIEAVVAPMPVVDELDQLLIEIAKSEGLDPSNPEDMALARACYA